MPTNSPILSLLSVISLLSFFIVLLVNKYSHKIGKGILLDEDFDKPQAFHKFSVARSGGLAGILSLIFFFVLYDLIFGKLLLNFLILSTFFFLLGFLEDIKLKINPYYRLILMLVVLLFFVNFFSITIDSLDLKFLSNLMTNSIFEICFIILCFLFIVNGANLVDGFNGLLTIHLIIINSILLYLNLNNGNDDLTLIITAQIVILISFLLFNFPKAQMFLGDSGSYMFGSLLAFNVIETNNLNPGVSSFFFCILLFYLFFEVFFSFFRKLYMKASPLKPDKNHLHMLLYSFLVKSRNFNDCNYLNSLFINIVYLCLILPGIFFNHSGLICKYWFFALLLIYLIIYFSLYSFEKKQ